MTPEQKRVHLAVHGFVACVMGSLIGNDTMDYSWRLYVPGDPGQRNLSKMGGPRHWRIGRMSSNVASYTPRELSQVPDELLDQLDLSLVEQLCNPFDPSTD